MGCFREGRASWFVGSRTGNFAPSADDNVGMKRLSATSPDPLFSRSGAQTLGSTGSRCPTSASRQEFRQLLEPGPRGNEDDRSRSVSGSPPGGRPLGDEQVGGASQPGRRGTDDSEPLLDACVTLPEPLLALVRSACAAEPAFVPATWTMTSVDAIANEIVRAVSVQQVSGKTTLRIQVSTPQLSRLDVDLKVEGGKVSVSLALTDAAEYRLVRAAMPDLEAGLRDRSIDVAPVRIQLRSAMEQSGDHPGHRSPSPALDEPSETVAPTARRVIGPGASPASQRIRSGTDYVV